MPKIKIESLREGMVVAADVKNMDSMLLLPAGCEISAKHVDILGAWGIAEIEVEASEDVEEPQDILQTLAPEVVEQLTKELQVIFWEPADANPVQAETFKLALRRKASQRKPAAG